MKAKAPSGQAPKAYVTMPNGGLAKRCQATSKRSGKRCGKPAREGFEVCSTHGAGTRKREQDGTHKRAGGAVTTGRYSTTPLATFAEMQAEVEEMEGALESSDADLIALRALMRLLLTRLEAYLVKLDVFEYAAEQLEALLTSDLTSQDARSAMNVLRDARRVVVEFNRLIQQASDVAQKNVAAHLARATTATRLAEQKGVEVFVELCQTQRAVVAELAPSVNWVDAYESALRRQIFGKRHLELPKELPQLEFPIDDEVAAVKAEPRDRD